MLQIKTLRNYALLFLLTATLAFAQKTDLEKSVRGVLPTTSGGTGTTTGEAPTATALALDPTDCTANLFATTIATNGDLTCSSAYATIQEEGAAVAQQPILNLIGTAITCIDNPGATRTDCTFTAGGGEFSAAGGVITHTTLTDALSIGIATEIAKVGITGDDAAQNALVVRGAVSQAATLQQWQNNAGSPLAWVTALGDIVSTTNFLFRSGTAFDGKFAHAISAARTWTFPNVTANVVLDTGAQILVDKTIDGDLNTLLDIPESAFKSVTKGDIYVDDGVNVVRLPVGTDTQILTADSGEASGIKWSTPAAAGGASTDHYDFYPSCGSIGTFGSGAGLIDIGGGDPTTAAPGSGLSQRCSIEFSATADQDAAFMWRMPTLWGGGPIEFTLIAYGTTSNDNQIRIRIATQCTDAGEATLSATFNAAQNVDIATGPTSARLFNSTLTGVTTTGCSASDMMIWHILRPGSSDTVNDTYTGAYALLGLEIKWSE